MGSTFGVEMEAWFGEWLAGVVGLCGDADGPLLGQKRPVAARSR